MKTRSILRTCFALLAAVALSESGAAAPASRAPSSVSESPGPSPRPSAEDWISAAPLALPRPHALCTAHTLREWVRISCESPPVETYFGVRVLGGPQDDVRINDRAPEPNEEKNARGTEHRGVDVVFPMRVDDRRLIEIGRIVWCGFRCYSVGETTEVVISALWLKGAADPTIVVL